MSFQQGLSGLNAAAKALDVLGNNIANSGTVGFKSSSALFGDVYAASLGSGSQVGIGVAVGGINQQFTQGNLTVSSNPLDIAINGQGMFRLSNNGATTFTRNGQFNIDKNGFVVNASGYRLTGYLANTANVIVPSTPAEIFINTADLQPQPTGNSTAGARIGLNLDSRQPVNGLTFNVNDPTTYNSSTSITVFDSLGNPHLMSIYFKKGDGGASVIAAAGAIGTAASTAALAAVPPATAGEAAAAAAAATAAATAGSSAAAIGAAAAAAIISSPIPAAAASAAAIAATPATPANTWQLYTNLDGGTASAPTTLLFNSTGALTSPATGIIPQSHAVGTGATTPLDFNLNLTGSTQYGNIFGVNSVSQDGYTSGRLSGLSIAADGTIQGRYSNGQSRDLAQVVLANFNNPNGLSSLGNNQWGETADSGQPLVGVPGSGSLGVVQSAAFEESNVDLTAELVSMITQQRAYQANAQTIKTQDQILQTLVNLR
jgi:flagellar hook protein FlgE